MSLLPTLIIMFCMIPAAMHIITGKRSSSHTHTHTLCDAVSLRQTRPAAERDRHAAAPRPGQADAPPGGLRPHLHRLRQLQPQAHRRGHLPAARRAQEAH